MLSSDYDIFLNYFTIIVIFGRNIGMNTRNTFFRIFQGLFLCLTCLLRNPYEGQEATVKTQYGTTDWFKVEKGIRQGCLLSPCLFNLYAEHIMRNAGMDELQAGLKIGRRNINNLRYVHNTTLMAESEEEIKSPLMRVKEESERAGLKLNIKKN